ncbi:pyruvate dehydrogenase complex dihydrolipoyllysine-residue acetyltransferase [Gilliamella sp. Pra-s60]|uniref:pyruvate dehydrogenase complex dihydrolipoyllysine-residue acetyltransferase n=1 Tax=unclassified Gilliamella TaxID=2685620 RepID=UPI001320CB22|nr:pyruvate dehydrogenase complex dihydrolipoyllysine-residue acetyltransferase [Gilliamella sp. Pra-s60]MWP29834.1 pyruvate dehydrogenase complex dihydrolipoyllysine-residue acetyltransferase [Gilliamella sp. Pra-s54]
MSIQIKLPDIGGDEVEVTEILVNVGDKVEADQSIMTVEGDKASMEIPAPQAGIVKSISVKIGDKVKTGVDIMVFDEEGGVASAAPAPAQEAPKSEVAPAVATASQTVDVNVPDIGGDEVEVTEILVKVGDTISVDDSLITVEGDKASMEIPATIAGTVKSITVKVGDKVKTGSKIMEFETVASNAPATVANAAPAVAEKPAPAAPVTSSSAPVTAAVAATPAGNDFVENDAYAHATPSVRRLAREFGVNLAKVTATGPKHRILREDIQTYVKNAVKQIESGATGGALPGLLPWPKVDFSKFGEVESLPLTKIQKVSGANLHRNWVMIPHVTEFDETDITDLEAFRKQQNAEADKKKLDLKITPLVFIMKAVASALTAYPRFNSSLSEDAQTLIIKKYINIGVAVDTPNGLVVPVFKDVDKKGIVELSRELATISKKAREGKLTGSDMQGGCFTISSLGGIGTTSFTPIVNAPEVGILGVSRSSMKPVWNGKEFTPRLMLPLSLSFDHRVIDGADGARFLSHIVNVLSDLRRLVM